MSCIVDMHLSKGSFNFVDLLAILHRYGLKMLLQSLICADVLCVFNSSKSGGDDQLFSWKVLLQVLYRFTLDLAQKLTLKKKKITIPPEEYLVLEVFIKSFVAIWCNAQVCLSNNYLFEVYNADVFYISHLHWNYVFWLGPWSFWIIDPTTLW